MFLLFTSGYEEAATLRLISLFESVETNKPKRVKKHNTCYQTCLPIWDEEKRRSGSGNSGCRSSTSLVVSTRLHKEGEIL